MSHRTKVETRWIAGMADRRDSSEVDCTCYAHVPDIGSFNVNGDDATNPDCIWHGVGSKDATAPGLDPCPYCDEPNYHDETECDA